MKKVLGLLSLLIISAMMMHAATAEARHTHGVFYPGLDNQPVLQLKIKGVPGEKIKSIRFSSAGSTSPSKFKGARLSSSGKGNAFTLHTKTPRRAESRNLNGARQFCIQHKYRAGG